MHTQAELDFNADTLTKEQWPAIAAALARSRRPTDPPPPPAATELDYADGWTLAEWQQAAVRPPKAIAAAAAAWLANQPRRPTWTDTLAGRAGPKIDKRRRLALLLAAIEPTADEITDAASVHYPTTDVPPGVDPPELPTPHTPPTELLADISELTPSNAPGSGRYRHLWSRLHWHGLAAPLGRPDKPHSTLGPIKHRLGPLGRLLRFLRAQSLAGRPRQARAVLKAARQATATFLAEAAAGLALRTDLDPQQKQQAMKQLTKKAHKTARRHAWRLLHANTTDMLAAYCQRAPTGEQRTTLTRHPNYIKTWTQRHLVAHLPVLLALMRKTAYARLAQQGKLANRLSPDSIEEAADSVLCDSLAAWTTGRSAAPVREMQRHVARLLAERSRCLLGETGQLDTIAVRVSDRPDPETGEARRLLRPAGPLDRSAPIGDVTGRRADALRQALAATGWTPADLEPAPTDTARLRKTKTERRRAVRRKTQELAKADDGGRYALAGSLAEVARSYDPEARRQRERIHKQRQRQRRRTHRKTTLKEELAALLS